MKYTYKLGLGLLSALAFNAALTSCEDDDMYSVDAPEWIAGKIDSIAAANKVDLNADTIKVDIMVQEVGSKDCSAGWWTAFSQSFEVPSGKKLTMEYVNQTSGANNWNNWNLAVATNPDRDNADYAEYFVLRSDNYGWGGAITDQYPYEAALIKNNYPLDADGNTDWDKFRELMAGARVTLSIDHSATGYAFVTAKAIATDGTELVETFENKVSSSDNIYAFLVADGSYMEMKKAYLTKSEITAIEDVMPAQLVISGVPSAIELGQTDFVGNGLFTVVYADGTQAAVDTADVQFTIPDLSTLGQKVIIATYSTSKQGELCTPVSAYYTVDVVNPVKSIAIAKMPNVLNYYYFADVAPELFVAGIEVEAVHVDATTSSIDLDKLQFSALEAKAGTQTVTITYQGSSSTIATTFDVEVSLGSEAIGAPDFSNGWWSTFSADRKFEGQDIVFDMQLRSDNAANYHSPCIILRRADLSEYCVVRMDHFGWGDSYNAEEATSDWNWDTFAANQNGADVKVTISVADGLATIRYDVTYANGEQHFQQYAGIAVDAADLQAAIVTEESYIVLK